MRFPAVLSTALFLGLSTGAALGDSSPVMPPEPVEVAPAEPAHEGERHATPVVETDDSAPVAGGAIEPTVVSARSESSRAARPDSAPAVFVPEPVTNKPVPGKIARQHHSSYYVNRVRLLLPAGIKVTVRKDWYAKEIFLVYPANPYTNSKGVTPDALVFRHTGTSLEVVPSGTRYMPTELTVIAPTPIEVEVR